MKKASGQENKQTKNKKNIEDHLSCYNNNWNSNLFGPSCLEILYKY